MSKTSLRFLLVVLGALALVAVRPAAADEPKEGQGMALHMGTVQEAEAKSQLSEPNHGYVGELGSFILSTEGHSHGLIVVHKHPDNQAIDLGRTKLTYEGSKRLGNVDGWVFKTEWDGKAYPSKIFFSAEKVYFGGGVNAYIAADYREQTGWAWKLLPLRRMGVAKNAVAAR